MALAKYYLTKLRVRDKIYPKMTTPHCQCTEGENLYNELNEWFLDDKNYLKSPPDDSDRNEWDGGNEEDNAKLDQFLDWLEDPQVQKTLPDAAMDMATPHCQCTDNKNLYNELNEWFLDAKNDLELPPDDSDSDEWDGGNEEDDAKLDQFLDCLKDPQVQKMLPDDAMDMATY